MTTVSRRLLAILKQLKRGGVGNIYDWNAGICDNVDYFLNKQKSYSFQQDNQAENLLKDLINQWPDKRQSPTDVVPVEGSHYVYLSGLNKWEKTGGTYDQFVDRRHALLDWLIAQLESDE